METALWAILILPAIIWYLTMRVENHYKDKARLEKFLLGCEVVTVASVDKPKVWVGTPPKKIITNFELETPEVHGWMK